VLSVDSHRTGEQDKVAHELEIKGCHPPKEMKFGLEPPHSGHADDMAKVVSCVRILSRLSSSPLDCESQLLGHASGEDGESADIGRRLRRQWSVNFPPRHVAYTKHG